MYMMRAHSWNLRAFSLGLGQRRRKRGTGERMVCTGIELVSVVWIFL